MKPQAGFRWTVVLKEVGPGDRGPVIAFDCIGSIPAPAFGTIGPVFDIDGNCYCFPLESVHYVVATAINPKETPS